MEEEQFSRLDEAIDAYEEVLGEEPAHGEAIGALERLYVAVERWEPLLDTYQRHLESLGETPDPETATALLTAMGRVYAERQDDLPAAVSSYQRILGIAPGHPESLEALAALYERQQDWDAVVRTLQQQADQATEPDQVARVWTRIGRVAREHGSDEQKATEHFYAALDHDPRCIEAMDALSEIFGDKEDWGNVVRMLKRKEEVTMDLVAKAAVLLQIGRIYQDKLGDEVAAVDYFDRCIALDSENVDAAQPLVEMYLREQKWERAEPLLDTLIRRLGQSREAPDLHLLYYNAGLVAEHLKKDDAALRHYRSAYELDATHLPTLEGLGRLLFQREDWDRAFKIFQTILVHHREVLRPDQTVEIFHRLGTIKLKVGERARARAMFDKALEVDAQHRPTLEALIELHGKQGDWERVVGHKQALVGSLYDGQEQFSLLMEIGDIWRDQLRQPEQAISAYSQALERNPDSRVVLTHLLKLYNEAQQWEEAIGILERLIDMESDTAKLAKFHNTIAVLYRDKLANSPLAVTHFNKALKSDAGLLSAFEAIDRLLTVDKNWEGLEQNYRKMLKRVKDVGVGGAELEAMLWRNLGEIYRTRMGKFEEATTAFAEASKLMPEDQQLHQIIGDLHERTGGFEHAAAAHHELIRLSPFRVESYRSLYRLYIQMGRYDEAWCMCGALAFLREATPEEQEFYDRYKGPSFKRATRVLDDERWRRLVVHPWYNEQIGHLLAMLGQLNLFAVKLKDWGLKKRDRHDLSQPLLFNKVFQYVAEQIRLGPFTPVVFLRSEQFAGIKNGNMVPWSLVIGPDMLSGRTDREIAFMLGRQLSLFRPQYYLAGLGLPTTSLKLLFFASWHVVDPSRQLPIPGDPQQFANVAQDLVDALPKQQTFDLQKAVDGVVRTSPDINLSRWSQAVDHTATRMGLLMCGDLDTAARLVKNDANPVSKATPKERIKELVLYSISQEHFEARKMLGVDIGG